VTGRAARRRSLEHAAYMAGIAVGVPVPAGEGKAGREVVEVAAASAGGIDRYQQAADQRQREKE
jgi:hypothetical protein